MRRQLRSLGFTEGLREISIFIAKSRNVWFGLSERDGADWNERFVGDAALMIGCAPLSDFPLSPRNVWIVSA